MNDLDVIFISKICKSIFFTIFVEIFFTMQHRVILLYILIIPAFLFAQKEERYGKNFKFKYGIMGHYLAGMSYTSNQGIEKELQKSFGNTLSLSRTGYCTGGGGSVLFRSGLIVGGKGGLSKFSYSYTDSALVRTSDRWGFINLGIAVFNKNQFLLYPYLGLGWGSSDITVKNESVRPQNLHFDKNMPLQAGEARKYTSRTPVFEAGFSFNYLIAQEFGIMLGLDTGMYYLADISEWRQAGREVSGLRTNNLMNTYVKMRIGIGLFDKEFR